jgi:protein-S-isoprenylcysteine O-methyltransferase Ste14
VSDGTRVPSLGRRGEGWVLLQSIAFVAAGLAAALGPRWPDAARWPLIIVGVLMAAGGAAMIVSGFVGLGRDLTPFPRPGENAPLRTGGSYGLVRHPIYGGLLLLFFGGALATSPVALIPTFALAVIFELKRHVEESWLAQTYPEYTEYRSKVGRAFVPGIW